MAEFIFPGTEARVMTNLGYSESAHLGCHTNSLMRIQLQYPTLVSDPKKEFKGICNEVPQLLADDRYVKKFWDFLKTDEAARHTLYTELSNVFKGVSIVFMSGPCNTEDFRPDKSAFTGKYSVADFAGWLKKQGQYIMATPLVTNANHQTVSFSILRGWMWIPDHRVDSVRHIAGTEYISGSSKSFLSFPDWRAHYKKYHAGMGGLSRYDTPGRYTPRKIPELAPFEPEELFGS
jgi:hypothetical protein